MTLRSDLALTLKVKVSFSPWLIMWGYIYMSNSSYSDKQFVKYYDLSAFALFLLNLKVKIKAFTKSLEHDNNNNSW